MGFTTRFCMVCGRPNALRDRILSGIKNWAEVISFLATAIALIFLIRSTNLTNEQVNMQRISFEDERGRSIIQDSLSQKSLDLLSIQVEELKKDVELKQRVFTADSASNVNEFK